VIKALVSIEVDLASSMAVRLACQLGGLMEMEIQPVYVRQSAPHSSAIGTGWASRTWEREMIEQGKAEISELLTSEMDFCPVLRDPKVIYGDRDAELLKITHAEPFDLYVEGVHFPWTATDFYKSLHAKLYQKLPSPLVLVRTLRKINHVAVLCLDVRATHTLTSAFQTLWENSPVPVTLVYPSAGTGNTANEELSQAVEQAKRVLEEAGCSVSIMGTRAANPTQEAEEILHDFAIVAIAIERSIKKEGPELQWLSLVKTAALLAFH